MMSIVDFATHADLTGRLRGLVILLDEHLTSEQIRSVDEEVDASEFGIALESLADWLGANETPIPGDIRRDFERLSSQLGIGDRVMGALQRCPSETDA